MEIKGWLQKTDYMIKAYHLYIFPISAKNYFHNLCGLKLLLRMVFVSSISLQCRRTNIEGEFRINIQHHNFNGKIVLETLLFAIIELFNVKHEPNVHIPRCLKLSLLLL